MPQLADMNIGTLDDRRARLRKHFAANPDRYNRFAEHRAGLLARNPELAQRMQGVDLPMLGPMAERGMRSPAAMPGSIDPRAVMANPEGFQRHLQGAMEQERMRPGSTFLSQSQGRERQPGPTPLSPQMGQMDPQALAALLQQVRARRMGTPGPYPGGVSRPPGGVY